MFINLSAIFSQFVIFDSFSIDKFDETNQFGVNLEVKINIDDKSSTVPILTDTRIPIPICNNNFSLSDFGVSSIAEIAKMTGTNIAQAGIDWVLTKLGIKVSLKDIFYYDYPSSLQNQK